MTELKVLKIDLKNYKKVAIHLIDFPQFGDDGFYRTATSYSAFFESLKNRNKSKKHLYYVDQSDSIKCDFERELEKTLPKIKHNSLYDFFEYIGYDSKSKKIQ